MQTRTVPAAQERCGPSRSCESAHHKHLFDDALAPARQSGAACAACARSTPRALGGRAHRGARRRARAATLFARRSARPPRSSAHAPGSGSPSVLLENMAPLLPTSVEELTAAAGGGQHHSTHAPSSAIFFAARKRQLARRRMVVHRDAIDACVLATACVSARRVFSLLVLVGRFYAGCAPQQRSPRARTPRRGARRPLRRVLDAAASRRGEGAGAEVDTTCRPV